MYLEKLKILGFKSFAHKTNFIFTDGITSIVGPNGCGKSNIVDAIRWVLGEQKAGILRSDQMENVIFNGTKELKPMGMAEVSLTIQNTKNVLPVEYTEVVITRRIFRSGESQYLLNNSICRLKDINDLLMDTGITPDAYSVIELSMVETILSGKPEERRRIFEEAAGITKYKQRRRISFRKLESTENDLVRIEDIITEVENKVNSLRRQVRKAQRYQAMTDQLKEIEIRAATNKYSKIYTELIPLADQLEHKKRERESSTAQISFKDAEVESLKTELIQLEQNLRNSQQKLNSINDLIRKREQEILVSRERLKSLENNNNRLQIEINQLNEKIREYDKSLEKLSLNLRQISIESKKVEKNYQQQKQALEAIEQKLQEKRKEGKQAENEIRQLLDLNSQKRGTVEHLNSLIQYMKDRISELQQEKAIITDRIASYHSRLQTLAKKDEQNKARQINLTTQHQQFNHQLEKMTADFEGVKEEIVKNYSQLDTLKHKIAIVNKLLESYADYPEGVQHLMVENKGYIGTIADIISVEDKYRQAIEMILGEAATYLLVEDSQQAFLGIKSLQESQKGVVTFLPLNRFTNNEPNHPSFEFTKSQQGIIGWADEIVHCDKKYRPLLNMLMGNYLIVSDLSIIETTKKIDSINIVTLSGEMIAEWGAIKGGQKSLDDTSVIGRRDQLNKFELQINEIQQSIQKAEQKKQQLEQLRDSIQDNIKDSQRKITTLEKENNEIKLGISKTKYAIDQSEERIQKIDQEIITLDKEIKATQQKIDGSKNELEQVKQLRISTEDSIFSFNQELESLNTEREQLIQKIQQFNLNLVRLNSEAKNLKNDIEHSHQIISESKTLIKDKNNELIENKRLIEDITHRIDDVTSSIADDYKEKEKLEELVTSLEQQQASLKENINQREKTIRQLRNERETFAKAIHTMELRIAELKLNADNLYRQIKDDYNWELKHEPIDEAYDLEADEEEIERLTQRIKASGPVNLLALKEYESEKERLDFLKKQHNDLIEAKQNLNETITQINKTACEKFNEVFLQIRDNFSHVFRQFFSEGEAYLRYSETEDPLEANIEIVANPKGKRATSLTLLSGGEKALTAISLLFAIYLVKPSPFCILDEVDAPLDDTNILRFIAALKEFSKKTQFLIVTHNKLTMKSANCLYGITMENNGVSKVVSVKLD